MPQPAALTRSYASDGDTAGTIALTGTRSRTGAGQPTCAASTAAASHGTHSASSYSANGQNSPHPAGPSMSIPSRTVIRRKRVVRPIA